MKIETKIAKNGTKMYYRVDETGKLRRISADEARHAEYMNGVYKAIEEKKATKIAATNVEVASIEETADATKAETATVEEKAEVIIPIVDYRTLLTWAEKVSNGQHDTAIQIVTHIKKWFNAETDKKTVIEVIKAGDLNGFRNFLCQFNFAVKDDGGCIHKLYRYDNGECVLAEIPTNEYAKYSTEETAETTNVATELPKGDITVESGAETVIKTKITSNNSIVVKINGKRVGRFDAQDAICGHDYQTNPVKIISELGEVFIGGIDRENNVYVFEWQGCGQVFEMPLSNDPIRLITWRNLADYRETPAPVKPEPAIEWPKPDSPCAIANGLNGVFQNVVRRISYMDVTTQDGNHIATRFGNAYIEPDWSNDDGYVFTNGMDIFARYDTPEQVIDAMTALRDTIKRGETQFCFPTANQPAEPAIDSAQIEASLTRAMNIALEHYKGFCHIGNLTAAENELKLYNICRKATSELWKE